MIFEERSKTRVRGLAHAKLNLFLEVLGRREDGFHELVSVFQEIDLADRVAVELCPDEPADRLDLRGATLDCTPEENLVLRAARAVRSLAPDLPSVRVELDKFVPSGGGLGGGSTDAAFVLRALAELHPGAWTRSLGELAATLGSDVPFFLQGGTAVCRGRGERIEAIDRDRRAWFVLLAPPFGCSTAAVYAHLRLTGSRREVKPFLEEFGRWPGEGAIPCFNRLQESAFDLVPSLAALCSECSRLTRLPWFLTGSGSVLYAPCATESLARAAAASLREIPESRVFVSASRPTRPMD